MNCTFCNKELTEEQIKNFKKTVNSNKNITGNSFCSRSCGTSYRLKNEALYREKEYTNNPVLCKCCFTKISYSKYVEKKTEKSNRNKKLEDINMFCGKSCAAKHNNKGKNRHSVINREIKKSFSVIESNIIFPKVI